MDSWRIAFRTGIAPCLSTAALRALRHGLAADDPALIQGTTVQPPPLVGFEQAPVECACPAAYALWKAGEGRHTVAQVEGAFADLLYEAQQLLGWEGEGRLFLNWIDETPRAAMRRELLAEVEHELAERSRKGVA